MDYTHVLPCGPLHGFYNGDVFCTAYHDDDLSVEWKQLEFILDKANLMVDFHHAEWYGGKEVIVHGLDHHQILSLDCKLLNFQFGNKLPLERQLQLVCKED